MIKRLEAEDRKQIILDAAVERARQLGLSALRRDDIALKAGCATGLVTHYFGTMIDLRRAVVGAAIAREILPIIAQAIHLDHPRVKKLDPELRARALASV